MSFFDTSRTKIGRVCMTNAARSYSEKWQFDYIGLSVENLKKTTQTVASTKKLITV